MGGSCSSSKAVPCRSAGGPVVQGRAGRKLNEVRLVFKERPADGKYVKGVNCWSVYAGDVREGMALLGQWLGPVRLAMACGNPEARLTASGYCYFVTLNP